MLHRGPSIPKLVLTLISISQLPATIAVKFPRQNGITVADEGALMVGQFSSLSCNFIKWRQETISKIVWSISYKGVSSNVFTSFFETGAKDAPNSRYFKVDPNSSGEKVVRLMLQDDRETEVNICCKVESVRDSGYGNLKRSDKEKCVAIPVIAGDIPTSIELNVAEDAVRVGEKVNYLCKVKEGRGLTLAISVNNDIIKKTSRGEDKLQSNFTVLEEHFNQISRTPGSHRRQGRDDHITVQCTASRGATQLAKEIVLVERNDLPSLPDLPAPKPEHKQPRKGRFYSDPKFHSNHGKVPCHSYVLLEENYSQGTIIKGDLPISIQGYIDDLRLTGSSYSTADEPIQVLNTLGYNGYRVVGFSAHNQRNTWTLEREYYEFH